MTRNLRLPERAQSPPCILKHARESGNVALTCRYFGIGRSTFYEWKTRFDKGGLESLEKKKPIGKRWPNQLSDEAVEKILHLRKTYHLGPERIMWYLERYHGTKICCNSVYRTLVRNGVGRLPQNAGRRKVHTKRYAKKVPGHHIQFDVKSLSFQTTKGKKVNRYQYTAIDDATRVARLKWAGYRVQTTHIPEDITPKTRLLLGWPNTETAAPRFRD